MIRRVVFSLVLLVSLVISSYAGVTCDGTDDLLTATNESNFDCTNTSCTVSFWMKTTASTSPRYIVSKNGAGTGWQITYLGTGSTIQVIIRDSGGGSVASRSGATTVNDGAMHHVGVVLTTSTTVSATNDISIYIDGSLSQGSITRNGNFYSPNNNDVVLCKNTVGSTFWAGSLWDVRIFSGNIGDAAIANLAQSRQMGLPIPYTELGEWPLDACTGGASVDGVVFADRSGGGSTLTADNGANNTGMTCAENNYFTRR